LTFITDDLDAIFEYGFTESIISKMRWETNLLDFSIMLDYWRGPGQEEKQLKLVFKRSVKVDFMIPHDIALVPENEWRPAHSWSWFTIIWLVEADVPESLKNRYSFNELKGIEIYTDTGEEPTFFIVCEKVELYDVTQGAGK
jgi:hypothetical protein